MVERSVNAAGANKAVPVKHKKRSQIKVGDIVTVIIITAICFVTVYPFWFIIVASISDGAYIIQGKITFYPIGINFDAYKVLFNYSMVGRGYLNTLFYVPVATVISMVLTILGAYPLSRKEFAARKELSIYVAFTMLFNGGMIPTYLVVVGLNMFDTVFAFLIPSAMTAFNLIVLRTFFQSIPDAIIEAARIDGSGNVRTLISVVLPCSVSGIATVFLFYLVGHWNSFMPGVLYIAQNQQLLPIQNILRKIVIQEETFDPSMSSSLAFAEGVRYAAIVITALPIIMVYPFLQKYFQKGLMIGGIKG